MKSVRRVSSALLLFLCGLASCSELSGPPWEEIADIIGIYRLESVDGAPLPGLVFQDDTSTVHVLQGSMELDRDFQFSQRYRLLRERGGEEIDSDVIFDGRFSRDGADLMLEHRGRGSEAARLTGDVLTLTTLDGLTFVFSKTDL